MSALGDALLEKNKESAIGSKITITVDSLVTAEAVSYAVRLEAPGYSEVLLEGQSDVEVAAAVAEFTAWAAGLW